MLCLLDCLCGSALYCHPARAWWSRSWHSCPALTWAPIPLATTISKKINATLHFHDASTAFLYHNWWHDPFIYVAVSFWFLIQFFSAQSPSFVFPKPFFYISSPKHLDHFASPDFSLWNGPLHLRILIWHKKSTNFSSIFPAPDLF